MITLETEGPDFYVEAFYDGVPVAELRINKQKLYDWAVYVLDADSPALQGTATEWRNAVESMLVAINRIYPLSKETVGGTYPVGGTDPGAYV